MKQLAFLVTSMALASSAFAGPIEYTGKAAKDVIEPPLPPCGCQCFAPGLAMGIFAGYYNPYDCGSSAWGGGALAEMFFTENFGLQLSYGAYNTKSTHHQIDGDIMYRVPIKSLCIAPYVMVGGGIGANSVNTGSFHAGGGIEARFDALNCMGLFVDVAYHWAQDDMDFLVVRAGIKVAL